LGGGEVDEGGVDAVYGGAAHESDDVHGDFLDFWGRTWGDL